MPNRTSAGGGKTSSFHEIAAAARLVSGLAVLLAAFACALPAMGAVNHRVRAELAPGEARVTVTDRIEFGREIPREGLRFLLHRGMAPKVVSPGWTLAAAEGAPGEPEFSEAFKALPGAAGGALELSYSGAIAHEPEPVGKEYARGFSSTPGIISPAGAVLSGESLWLPEFPGEQTTFDLTATLPSGWDAVSQGELLSREVGEAWTKVRYRAAEPGEGAYLIAARFTRYEREAGGVAAYAYLREPDPALAAKYLDATAQYVAMYSKLIGPYPFKKFALVENFWETGFGMPSFTLLGSKVIRFPFLLRSSYPHEILHNWWGNGVYVDYSSGNWCEGLTAYLADHLLAEQAGGGTEYREATLQKYADYVAKTSDMPLTAFTSRHSASTEALGYGKALMVFHMLRMEVGDEKFVEGLRLLFRRRLFTRASWKELAADFSEAAGRDLSGFFAQWVERTGAPVLGLTGVRAERSENGWVVTGEVDQTQPGASYSISVQVAVTTKEGPTTVAAVRLTGAKAPFSISVSGEPVRVDADPWFDLFRRLSPEEIPPALSGAFGEERVTVILPSKAPGPLGEGYARMAEEWRGSGEGEYRVIGDDDPAGFPASGSVWVLGRRNRWWGSGLEALEGLPAAVGEAEFTLGKTTLGRENRSLVATGRKGGVQVTLLDADPPEAVAGLTRKLPHYHKYSYLAFEGGEPVNVVKGRWEALGSPLTVQFAATPQPLGAHPARPALAKAQSPFSAERMGETVRFLASPALGGRGGCSQGLEAAAAYVAEKFREAGLAPGGPGGSYFREFKGMGEGGECLQKNVVGFVPGSRKEWEGQAVVVGAHYDHLGLGWPDAREGNRGKVHPGADDNASGVAALLELARSFAAARPERSVVFAAFAGEEAGRTGSAAFLRDSAPWPASSMRGMINLDTVGRLGRERITVLGAGSASEWIHIFNGAGFVTGAKVEPAMKDIGSGDQTSFLDAGVPAVQLFTGAHSDYHSVGDVAERIDYDGLATVAGVAFEAIEYLAKREEPLSSTLKGAKPPAEAPRGGPRKVSLGTVPDFAWSGVGVRVAQVGEGSPAMRAGLSAGDVIVSVNGENVNDLKEFSAALKKLSPSDRVTVEYLRGEVRMKAEMTAATR